MVLDRKKSMDENMTPDRKKSGFTMMEMLIVVGIMAILAGVAFVSVPSYLRSMAKLEYDGYAKSIFVAAQNHLTMAAHEEYLGRTELGHKEEVETTETADNGTTSTSSEENGVYDLVVKNGSTVESSQEEMLDLLLPYGSVDETVRNGSYLIRYHKETARVLDVFYWDTTGRYAYTVESDSPVESGDSVSDSKIDTDFTGGALVSLVQAGQTEKSNLMTHGTAKSVLGYYGGETVLNLPESDLTLNTPGTSISNGDTLKITVTDYNESYTEGGQISNKLVITGKSSGKSIEIDLNNWENLPYVTKIQGENGEPDRWEITLDDITQAGMHFADICPGLIPGEDIEVVAYAQEIENPNNIAYSEDGTTNSLFGDGTTTGGKDNPDGPYGTAVITSVRHMQNLSKDVSNLDGNDTDVDGNESVSGVNSKVNISRAIQTEDISWDDFNPSTSSSSSGSGDGSGDGTGTDSSEVKIYPAGGSDALSSGFHPITPVDGFTYDGNGHTISDVVINEEGDAGLFSSATDLTVEDLVLENFDVTSTDGNAGALAGTLTDSTIRNVVVKNDKDHSESGSDIPSITSTNGDAGGVVGEMTGGTITGSGASVPVEATNGNAGGLIGSATKGTTEGSTYPTINGCYTGGHTMGGNYEAWINDQPEGAAAPNGYDIKGQTSSGGLVGDAGGSTIKNSYSTCSVQTTGDTGAAGGLVGKAGVNDTTGDSANGSITNSYATGLVCGPTDENGDPTGTGSIGSFAGTMTDGAISNASSNTIYGGINDEDVPLVGIDPTKTYADDDAKEEEMERVNSLVTGGDDDASNDKIKDFTSDTSSYASFVKEPEDRGGAQPYDTSLTGVYQGNYNLPTAAQLMESERETLLTELSDAFSKGTVTEADKTAAQTTIASLEDETSLTEDEEEQLAQAKKTVALVDAQNAIAELAEKTSLTEEEKTQLREVINALEEVAGSNAGLTQEETAQLESLKDLSAIYHSDTHTGDWPSPETLFVNEKSS